MTEANPLYKFRAPQNVRDFRHPHLDGGYINTKREDVKNDIGAFNIYPGMFLYKDDPTVELDFAIWEDMPDMQASSMFANMITHEGYNVCQFDDWEILNPVAEQFWRRDVAGRMTFLGKATSTYVLMWRTGEAAEEAKRKQQAMLVSVDRAYTDKQEELQDKYAPLGASVRLTSEDDIPVSRPTATAGR